MGYVDEEFLADLSDTWRESALHVARVEINKIAESTDNSEIRTICGAIILLITEQLYAMSDGK